MGANSGAAQSVLKAQYQDGCSLIEATSLAVKVLKKAIGSSTVLKPESSKHILCIFNEACIL